MRIEIISVGSELTAGVTVDTNAAWLSLRLLELGAEVVRHVTVGDEQSAIRDEIVRAAQAAEVVVVTGGLGPTPDDLTRQALAEAMGRPLRFDEAAWRQVEDRFARVGRTASESNKLQAMVPEGASLLTNDWGTAPGVRAELGGAVVYVMPGVPREMREMYAARVEPELAARSGGRVTLVRTVRTFGWAESRIGEAIGELMRRGRNPQVGTTAAEAIIGVRIFAAGKSRDEAQALCDADESEVRRLLGSIVFGNGEDELQDAVARLLVERRVTVATAESCTGGLVAKRLTDVAGSSAYFLQGFVTYSNESKTRELSVPAEVLAAHGAVSEETARAMALGCRGRTGADYALAITGIAGPGGGTIGQESSSGGEHAKPVGLVYHALADANGCEVRERRFGDHLSRDEIRDRAAKTALDMLRRRVMGLGVES